MKRCIISTLVVVFLCALHNQLVAQFNPDLALGPKSINLSDPCNISGTYTIDNIGNGSTGQGFSVEIWVEELPSGFGMNEKWSSNNWPSSLSAGGSATFSFSGLDIKTLAQGSFDYLNEENFKVYIKIDPNNAISDEQDETNNSGILVATVNCDVDGSNSGGQNPVENLPDNLSYLDAYPNPSTGEFTIQYELEKPAKTRILVTNMVGQTVKMVDNLENLGAGEYYQDVDLQDLPAGTYFYTLLADDKKATGKILLTK